MSKVSEGAVIITGGAGLLGRKFSEACAGAGYSVVIADINEAAGKIVADEIIQITNNPDVSFQKCDITISADIQALIRYCKEKYGIIGAF